MSNTCASVHTVVEFWVLALSIFFKTRSFTSFGEWGSGT